MLAYHFVTLVNLLHFGDSGLFVRGLSEMSGPQATSVSRHPQIESIVTLLCDVP